MSKFSLTVVGSIVVTTVAATMPTAWTEEAPIKDATTAKRQNPLGHLPSPPGPHIALIKELGDNKWLNLGTPKADPKWGVARGRSWGGRAFIYAPDIESAYFMGEGPHEFVKPDGHLMDDLWVYDVNGNCWIAAYPGTDTKSFSARVKAKELLADKDGMLVDKDGQPIPMHTSVHCWDKLSYDTDAHKFAFLGSPLRLEMYFLGGAAAMKEGLDLFWGQTGKPSTITPSPWFYDTKEGKFERYPVNPTPEVGGYPYFQYVKSRKQFFMGGDAGVA